MVWVILNSLPSNLILNDSVLFQRDWINFIKCFNINLWQGPKYASAWWSLIAHIWAISSISVVWTQTFGNINFGKFRKIDWYRSDFSSLDLLAIRLMSLLWFHLVIVYSGKLLERADTKTFLGQMCKITKLHEAFFLFFFCSTTYY